MYKGVFEGCKSEMFFVIFIKIISLPLLYIGFSTLKFVLYLYPSLTALGWDMRGFQPQNFNP
jgi:hypothetical protein